MSCRGGGGWCCSPVRKSKIFPVPPVENVKEPKWLLKAKKKPKLIVKATFRARVL